MKHGIAPILCSVLWSMQTISTALYVASGNTAAILVMGSVAAAEVCKALAAGVHCGWQSAHPQPHYLICAFCSVVCAALAYPVLMETGAANYVPLLAINCAIGPIVHWGVNGAAITRRTAGSAAAGACAYAIVAYENRWAAGATLLQCLLVSFADVIDATADDEPAREHFTASVFTSWTALMIFFGSVISDTERAIVLATTGMHRFALVTIALMAATGICKVRDCSMCIDMHVEVVTSVPFSAAGLRVVRAGVARRRGRDRGDARDGGRDCSARTSALIGLRRGRRSRGCRRFTCITIA